MSRRSSRRSRRQPAPCRARCGSGSARVGIELKTLFRDRESAVFTFAAADDPACSSSARCSAGRSSTRSPGITFAQYFVAGMIASGIVYTSFQNLAIGIPQERDLGTLKRLQGTPMPRGAYFLGKIGQVAVTYVGQLILLMAIGVLLFHIHAARDAASAGSPCSGCRVLGLTIWTLLGLAFSSVPTQRPRAPRPSSRRSSWCCSSPPVCSSSTTSCRTGCSSSPRCSRSSGSPRGCATCSCPTARR